jgi:3-phosphoshikimate 1-carboxyvinyltransferase
VIIRPAKQIQGRLDLPGDKSISHRAALIAALAEGTSRLVNFSSSADCGATLSCLQQLGVGIEREGHEVVIHGIGADGLRAPLKPLDCANSATTMRLLAGILAGHNFTSTLTGDASLRSRPMQRIIEPLRMMGANVSSDDGCAPLMIEGRHPLKAINYELLVASAQVKSCILLAGLSAKGQTKVIENSVTRDHTERMLRWFGVSIEVREGEREGSRTVTAEGPARIGARDVTIPGDLSSAAYFIAAVALLSGSSLEIANVGINPTRIPFLKQMRSFGFDVTINDAREQCNEPVGTVRARGSKTTPASDFDSLLTLRSSLIPLLIDELPLLAVVGTQIEGGIEIRDAAELRVKESDRIAATVQGLRAMKAEVEEFDDGLRVGGSARLLGAKIDSRGDHRIAMAFTIAALIAEGETEIKDADCVAVSFPDFFDLLESLIEQ